MPTPTSSCSRTSKSSPYGGVANGSAQSAARWANSPYGLLLMAGAPPQQQHPQNDGRAKSANDDDDDRAKPAIGVEREHEDTQSDNRNRADLHGPQALRTERERLVRIALLQ